MMDGDHHQQIDQSKLRRNLVLISKSPNNKGQKNESVGDIANGCHCQFFAKGDVRTWGRRYVSPASKTCIILLNQESRQFPLFNSP